MIVSGLSARHLLRQPGKTARNSAERRTRPFLAGIFVETVDGGSFIFELFRGRGTLAQRRSFSRESFKDFALARDVARGALEIDKATRLAGIIHA